MERISTNYQSSDRANIKINLRALEIEHQIFDIYGTEKYNQLFYKALQNQNYKCSLCGMHHQEMSIRDPIEIFFIHVLSTNKYCVICNFCHMTQHVQLLEKTDKICFVNSIFSQKEIIHKTINNSIAEAFEKKEIVCLSRPPAYYINLIQEQHLLAKTLKIAFKQDIIYDMLHINYKEIIQNILYDNINPYKPLSNEEEVPF